MGESSRRNFRERNSRSTCEGRNSKQRGNIQKDNKKRSKKSYPERKHKKMATLMGGNNERGDY